MIARSLFGLRWQSNMQRQILKTCFETCLHMFNQRLGLCSHLCCITSYNCLIVDVLGVHTMGLCNCKVGRSVLPWSEIETTFPFCLRQARQKKRWYWPERRPSKCWSQEQGRGSWSISMYIVYQFQWQPVLVVRIAQLKSPMRLDTAGEERNGCGKHEVLRCIRRKCSLKWHDNCIAI